MLTDFHSHILPGVDDGSSSVEESLAMLRLQKTQGILRVVATPHFYARYENPKAFLEKRDNAEKQLYQAISEESIFPKIEIGAEVYFFRGISESEFLQDLTIRNKSCILIEMPPPPWSERMYRELEEIWTRRGITPIIAHIDRYISPLKTHGIPQCLSQLPVLVQANANFFLSRRTTGMAMKMLKSDQIHILGSDCHNISSRKPNLGAAVELIERKQGRETIMRLRAYESMVLDV